MLIRLLGPDVPEPLLEAFATATDHAMLRPADVHHDERAAVVTVPLRLARVTLRSRRRALRNLLGFTHTAPGPTVSRLIVRHVITCKIDVLDIAPREEIHVIFGVHIDTDRLYAYSAEESSGRTCFGLEVTFSQLDIELATEPETPGQGR